MKDLYELKEDEGLERFDTALTKLDEFNSRIVQSKELNELTSAIAETNKKLQMRFKREHVYKMEVYEEQLYKEVVYDSRPNIDVSGEEEQMNGLKKARIPSTIRNMNEFIKEAREIVQWPFY